MASLVVAGVTIPPITDAATAFLWGTGIFYALPPLGQQPFENEEEFDELPIVFPGVDGVGIKNMGFRGRDIDTVLIYLNVDQAASEASKVTMLTALQGKRFSITVPGGTARNNCKIKRGGFRLQRGYTIGGRFALQAAVTFRQMDNSA